MTSCSWGRRRGRITIDAKKGASHLYCTSVSSGHWRASLQEVPPAAGITSVGPPWSLATWAQG